MTIPRLLLAASAIGVCLVALPDANATEVVSDGPVNFVFQNHTSKTVTLYVNGTRRCTAPPRGQCDTGTPTGQLELLFTWEGGHKTDTAGTTHSHLTYVLTER
ncbi:MAG TPA: hypothetical protein VM713_02555 [Steroidobacteraceae bacterium]|nr:hypothetical protein [Steroidobacteraceae bacterium]